MVVLRAMDEHGGRLSGIEALADWLADLLDAVGTPAAVIIGHSMGSLVALDFAGRYPARALGAALVATAVPMVVSDALLDAARQRESEAIDLVNRWSHSTIAAKPSCPGPGFWLHGVNQRLMERVAARGEPHLFHTDFSACNAYTQGIERAAQVRCPVRLVLGAKDMMTPARATRSLVDALKTTGGAVDVVTVDAGHALMSEQPDATLDALFAFARRAAAPQQV